ncbi:MAG: extracellular solute-binding protein [Chitinophagaceae bacterium]|nr:MAG: extracellular solute-binding protein [Chitinophagaceae bacterium]
MRYLLIFFSISLLWSCQDSGDSLNIYISRHYEIDDKVFRQFEERSGIKVNVLKADADQLIRRIEIEGEHSPADILITADAGRLTQAASKNMLAEIPGSVWEGKLDKNLISPDKNWLAITTRTRVIVYNPVNVQFEGNESYLDLAKPEYKGKILVRSAENPYNQSLAASIIYHHGTDKAEEWIKGIVENMARTPRGNDTDQIKGVAAGIGDIAIVNSYYLAKMHNSANPEEQRVAESLEILFPNQLSTGTHLNFSGAAILKNSKNKDHAYQMLTYMLEQDAQDIYMLENFEYPAANNIELKGFLKKWEPFRRDTLHLSNLAELQNEANRLLYKNGWN